MARSRFSTHLNDFADQDSWWAKGWAFIATAVLGFACALWLLAGLFSGGSTTETVPAPNDTFGTTTIDSGFGSNTSTGGLNTSTPAVTPTVTPTTAPGATTPDTGTCDQDAAIQAAATVVLAQVTGDWSRVDLAPGVPTPAAPPVAVSAADVQLLSMEPTATCGQFAVGIEFPLNGSPTQANLTVQVLLESGTWVFRPQGA